MSGRSDNWSNEACMRLGHAVIAEYCKLIVEDPSVSIPIKCKRNKKRTISPEEIEKRIEKRAEELRNSFTEVRKRFEEGTAYFWFALARRIDLYDSISEIYLRYDTFDDLRANYRKDYPDGMNMQLIVEYFSQKAETESQMTDELGAGDWPKTA